MVVVQYDVDRLEQWRLSQDLVGYYPFLDVRGSNGKPP
jgi:hypothetical protein